MEEEAIHENEAPQEEDPPEEKEMEETKGIISLPVGKHNFATPDELFYYAVVAFPNGEIAISCKGMDPTQPITTFPTPFGVCVASKVEQFIHVIQYIENRVFLLRNDTRRVLLPLPVNSVRLDDVFSVRFRMHARDFPEIPDGATLVEAEMFAAVSPDSGSSSYGHA